jgi:hypothetical protein
LLFPEEQAGEAGDLTEMVFVKPGVITQKINYIVHLKE